MARAVHVSSVHRAIDNRILNKECRSLARAGYDVVLLAPHEREEVVHGVRIRPLPAWESRLARGTVGAMAAVRRALAEAGDVYHLHDPELLPLAGWLRRRSGSPVIFDMHENLPKSLTTKSWLPPRLRSLAAGAWRAAERLLLRGVPVVFAERSYVRDYRRLEPAVVVENMVPTALASLEEEKHDRFTLVYVGSVARGRGIGVILDALARLWEAGEEVRFECVGPVYDDALRRELDRFASRWGDRVTVHGPLPTPEAMAAAARCHLGLAVLQPRPNYMESFPTKMFEYMALGLPVIASGFPLYREVLEPTGAGVCVDPEDAGVLADAILGLKRAPGERAAMGRRGREAVVEHYSWEEQERKLLEFYAALLGPKAPGRGG